MIKLYLPLMEPKKITCDCDDETCWKQMDETTHSGFYFMEDGTDLSYQGNFELPEGVAICNVIEVQPMLSDEQLDLYLKESFKVFGMKLPQWIVKMVIPAMQKERDFYEQMIAQIAQGEGAGKDGDVQ